MSVTKTAEIIRSIAGDTPIDLAMVLGSGLSDVADAVDGHRIPYDDLPGFPHAKVSGHGSELVVGDMNGVRVAVLTGREHYYENGRPDAMRHPLATVKELGAKMLLATNSAGSFRKDIPPGDLMLIRDHINYSGLNPLIGEASDARFVNLVDAYDPELRGLLTRAAKSAEIDIKEGVYSWYSGPSFETPAEIKMLNLLGSDAVGMSTVPEIILGRFFGLRCAAVSVITNMAAGMGDENISHEHTKAMAPIGAAKLARVIDLFTQSLKTGQSA